MAAFLKVISIMLLGGAALSEVGCSNHERVLVLNTRLGRQNVESACAAKSPVARGSCVQLGDLELGGYESQMVTAFAADPSCHGTSLIESAAVYKDVNRIEASAKWMIDVDWLPSQGDEKPMFNWNIDSKSKNRIFRGPWSDESRVPPATAIHLACEIIRGGGGTVR